jgi:hypothetical protein
MSKIPQGEWSAIAARYQAGESISKIARSYGCTPPAIHYILKRNRQTPTGATPQSAVISPSARDGLLRPKALNPALVAVPPGDRPFADDWIAPATMRRMPQDSAPIARRNEPLNPIGGRSQLVRALPPETGTNTQEMGRPEEIVETTISPSGISRISDSDTALPGHGSHSAGLPGLDDALHLRAEAAIALFRASFDQALTEGTPSVRERLRQAASDLMRVAARTTIVLDRLDASKERSARAHNYPRSAHAGEDLGKLG